jgi:hypothetical protein
MGKRNTPLNKDKKDMRCGQNALVVYNICHKNGRLPNTAIKAIINNDYVVV